MVFFVFDNRISIKRGENMPKRKGFDTKAILTDVYPLIENSLNRNLTSWKRNISNFVSKRSVYLFDSVPCERIAYSDADRDDFFRSLIIDRRDVEKGIKNTFYASITKFKPSQAKDALTIAALCVIRYFQLKKDQKNLELALIYFCFSGKLYPSVHYGSFPISPSKYRQIMEYVVNNQLTNKFELKSKGTVIGAIKSIALLWQESYTGMFKSFDDEDVCYVVQQIHNRIKSFMKNIARLYYDAYDNKEFISYQKDNLPEEGSGGTYMISDNDSFKLQKYVEQTIERLNTTQVEYKTCKACADANVHTEEVRSILEAIFNNRENIKLIKELITNMIASYMSQSSEKDVATLKFFSYSIKPKPNTKDPILIRIKEIVMQLLEDNSVRYRKRKHREATKQSYIKSLMTYFALVIIAANK